MREGNRMDILVTILPGIIILLAPFLLWFRSKARFRYEHDLAEIEGLVAERSEYVDELHTRLDTLEYKQYRREPTMSNDAAFETSRLGELILAYQTKTWRDIVAKRYSTDLTTLASESLRLEIEGRYYNALRYPRTVESETRPEWIKDVDPHELSAIGDLRRKGMWKQGGSGSLRESIPQPS